ncbi:MAG: Ig-like domain-containing protein [Candidatus Thorarchaeota archaeon]
MYSSEVTVTLTIESVNDIPIIVDDEYTGNEDELTSGNVLLNDYDVEWDDCQVFLVTGPLHGVLDLNSDTGLFTYQPDPDWFGIDSFTYNVFDGHMFSDVATVTLMIAGVNDAPIAYSVAFVGNEDVSLYATLPLATDVDGDVPVYELYTGPSYGVLTLDAGGTFGYRNCNLRNFRR